MKYLKEFSGFINESIGDLHTMMSHKDQIKLILETGDIKILDNVVKDMGGIDKFFSTFIGAVHVMNNTFAKTIISTMFSKNPKGIKKSNIDVIINHLINQHKLQADKADIFKKSIFIFIKNLNIPLL